MIDITDPEVIANPYPFLAREREQHGIAWSEERQCFLTFSHAVASAALRDRRLGRVWVDREPASYLEPFNLLHRNQMMENEPPEHTRLRRPVAAAFARGHVERLRPRVRDLTRQLLDETGPEFDAITDLAEPLPVLMIAELLGVGNADVVALRRWSQAIVKMYEPTQSQEVIDQAVQSAQEFADFARGLIIARRAKPLDNDLISELAASELSDDEVVAAVVLLLNAGHEATVNAFGNGLVGMLKSGQRPDPVIALTVEELLRFDAASQLFERTALEPVELGEVTIEPGQKVAILLGAANRDPEVFVEPDTFKPGRTPNNHLAFGAGVHFCLGSPLARMEMVESLGALFERYPDLHLDGEPQSRGTFVLRGYRRVPVSA
jgi:cytochrome P450